MNTTILIKTGMSLHRQQHACTLQTIKFQTIPVLVILSRCTVGISHVLQSTCSCLLPQYTTIQLPITLEMECVLRQALLMLSVTQLRLVDSQLISHSLKITPIRTSLVQSVTSRVTHTPMQPKYTTSRNHELRFNQKISLMLVELNSIQFK